MTCTTPTAYNAHINGKKHRNKASGKNNFLRCVICSRDVIAHSWASHVAGRPHINTAADKGVSPDVEGETITTDIPGQQFCDLCRTHVHVAIWGIHVSGRIHQRQERYAAFKAVLDEAERDKNGVTIEGAFDFAIVDPMVARSGLTLKATIKTIMPQSKIALVQITLASAKRSDMNSPYVFCFALISCSHWFPLASLLRSKGRVML